MIGPIHTLDRPSGTSTYIESIRKDITYMFHVIFLSFAYFSNVSFVRYVHTYFSLQPNRSINKTFWMGYFFINSFVWFLYQYPTFYLTVNSDEVLENTGYLLQIFNWLIFLYVWKCRKYDQVILKTNCYHCRVIGPIHILDPLSDMSTLYST